MAYSGLNIASAGALAGAAGNAAETHTICG